MKHNVATGLLGLWCMALTSVYGQIKIKGKITDAEDNSEVIGATVKLAGQGVITDVNGNFELFLPYADPTQIQSTTLNVSYVGYKKLEKKINVTGENFSVGNIKLSPDNLLQDIEITSDFVESTRQTPVAVSTITAKDFEQKLGAQDLPEAIKSVPGVYVSKSGGNMGGSRVNIRGFAQEYIAVAVNGIPVNDMENGKVYWNNFLALGDFTKTQQVQKGLGASKLALSSAGGTINTITKTTDVKMNGNIAASYGSNNTIKGKINYSTGLLKGDWAANVGFAYTQSDGYAEHTFGRAYSYFASLSKKIGQKHILSITAFGAPQSQNQRNTRIEGSQYEKGFSPRHNLNYGQGINETANSFHKPFVSLNHNWAINDKMSLNSAIYYSSGRGYGQSGLTQKPAPFLFNNGKVNAIYDDGTGHIDFNKIKEYNSGNSILGTLPNSGGRSKIILQKRYNQHDWVGGISNFRWEPLEGLEWTSGIDVRYYQGRHFTKIADLLGGNYFIDETQGNPNGNKELKEGDIIMYNNNYDIVWTSVYSQLEYRYQWLTTFINIAGSDNIFKRTDFFAAPENRTTPWRNRFGINIKGGLGINLDDYNNIYANGGFFSRAPYVTNLYNNNQNYLSQVKNEKIYSVELGYNFDWNQLYLGVNGYFTRWFDRAKNAKVTEGANTYSGTFYGMEQTHYGLELEAKYTAWKYLQVSGSFGLGDWRYNTDPRANLVNQNDLSDVRDFAFSLKGVKVADAAQMTAFVGLQSDIWKGLYVGLDFNYFDQLYADFNVEKAVNQKPTVWRIPAYYTMDARIGWSNIPLKNKWNMSVIGNVYNLTDNKYINEAENGSNSDFATSRFFYGQNISYLVTLKFGFM